MELSGNIVDVVAGRIVRGTLTIEQGRVAAISEGNATSDHYLIPGFVDAHVHVESSMLIPSEFARLAVCHGTVGTVSDPHEIGNVLGVAGVKFMIENGRKVPFKFCFGAPSCVPATTFETAGAEIGVDHIEALIGMPEIGYLAEMMDFPGVLSGAETPHRKMDLARAAGKPIDGHAPGLQGDDVRRYAEAGISTDHECFTREEALEKLQHGIKILIREGSAAKNFAALISLLSEFPEQIMFCSDDKHPNDLVAGHINHLAKRAVAEGCDPIDVLRACSLNPIRHYNLEIGLLQLGDPADLCIVRNLTDFEVMATYIDGIAVAEAGVSRIASIHEEPLNQFNCGPISAESISVESKHAPINVIEVTDGQLITKRILAEPKTVGGKFVSDPSQDLLKMVVVNRYFEAPPAIGFVRNFGLEHGAIASSVAHDCHNLIAVGVDDEDIVRAINRLVESQGGISLVNGTVTEVLELPIAGLMTNRDGYETAERYEFLDREAKALGSALTSPLMTLSFCALLVIPELKLGDRGLFDGNLFRFRSLHET